MQRKRGRVQKMKWNLSWNTVWFCGLAVMCGKHHLCDGRRLTCEKNQTWMGLKLRWARKKIANAALWEKNGITWSAEGSLKVTFTARHAVYDADRWICFCHWYSTNFQLPLSLSTHSFPIQIMQTVFPLRTNFMSVSLFLIWNKHRRQPPHFEIRKLLLLPSHGKTQVENKPFIILHYLKKQHVRSGTDPLVWSWESDAFAPFLLPSREDH